MHLNMKYPEIGRLMMAYDKKFKAFMKTALRKRELTVAEMLVMLSLSEADGQTQDQLLSQISYDKSVMARTTQSLEARGCITRSDNPEDRRSWLFHLAEPGREMLPDIIQALRDWCTLAFTGISDDDTEKLLEIMIKVYNNLDLQPEK